MLIPGIILLAIFGIFSMFLLIKGIKLGPGEVDKYGTNGTSYKILSGVSAVMAIGFCLFCHINYDPGQSFDSTVDTTPVSSYSSNSSSFSNKYGSSTTKCAIAGCNKYIAKSGDTNCCTSHSRKCLECKCYIDSDAMYCMDCLTEAAGGNSNSSKHECYICGDNAYSKYGSYYYCPDHLDLVKKYSN